MPELLPTVDAPRIPDHSMLRPIGRGACGEVWIARNAIGGLRAAKVTYRRTFTDDRPFLREFEGIQKFEPVSRTHPGLVAVLHVGRSESADYFYSIMDLADDARSGRAIDPQGYEPRTLRWDILNRGRLPAREVVSLGLALTDALGHLHAQGLIHRDIKPSNIIFVGGVPKFADIGLVTHVGDEVSHVGTPGYMPPEGPGGPQGDVYSLGKVLYELCTGKPCRAFPELPVPLDAFLAEPGLASLNQVILKACHTEPSKRYPTALEMHEALEEIAHPGAAVRRASARARAHDAPSQALDDQRPLVCVIDDDPQEIDIFSEVFGEDFRLIGGTRFSETLPKLRAMGVRPDLFVLDLYFPTGRDATAEEREVMKRMRSDVEAALQRLSSYCRAIGQDREGGLRLLEQVRREFREVPVVFYTRKGTLDDVAVCLGAGAVDVIRKPQPEVLVPGKDVFPQLVEATRSHRNSLLARFETVCVRRSWLGKLFRVIQFLRKNWGRL